MPSRADLEIRSNLKGVLDDLKKADKTLARDLRRSIRAAGEAITSEAGKILESESPGAVTARSYRRAGRGGAIDAFSSTGRSRGMREAVRKGLKTRVTNGKRGSTFKVVSATWNKDIPAGALNEKIFRHPLWGDTSQWSAQKGLQYFKRGIQAGGKQARKDLEATLEAAIDQLRRQPPVK